MVDNPTISVVIPCYNGERHVGEAIESALGQTYQAVEVIVIDDGSTDSSLEIIRSFGDAVRYESTPNRGACAARNRGVQMASGEFIQFLDADDLLHPHKLAKQVIVAVQYDQAIVYCDYERQNAREAGPMHVHSAECGNIDPVVFILQSPSLQTTAPLHRKSVLADIGGFREDLKASQEYDLHLRLASRGYCFVHVPEVLYTVRRLSASISSDFVRTVTERLRVLRSAMEILETTGELTPIRRMAFAAQLAKTGRKCLEKGNRELAASFYEEAAKVHSAAPVFWNHPAAAKKLQRVFGPDIAGWVLTTFSKFSSVESNLSLTRLES